MQATEKQILAGQAIYTRRALKGYDLVVLHLSNRLVWQCPTPRLVEHYNQQVTANHLDVGVGTGYFLDKCHFPTPTPRVALMDLNQNTLDFASRRIARYRPEVYRRNVLETIALDAPKFDSISINYLLHCIPGSIESKSSVLDHLKALMNPGAVIFGSTLLQGGVPRNWLARRLMEFYNKRGVFSNQNDRLSDLTEALRKRFSDVSVEVIGCAALFSGHL